MKRKEVVVGNQVFDLGIKGLEESVGNKNGRLPTIQLEVGVTIFRVGWVVKEKALTLNWWGLTSVQNIVWTRFIFLRLSRPLVKSISAFTYAPERE